MNRKWLPYLIILVLALVLFLVRRSGLGGNEKESGKKNQRSGEVNRNRGFDRRISFIEYTEHGKCRMKCRQISQAEVEEIMQQGKINYRKSNVKARPCPTYALEGVTKDKQRVRIVFAQCDYKTKVVTGIDLETDWECHCPGDDEKYDNQR